MHGGLARRSHLCSPCGPSGIQKVGHLTLRNVRQPQPSADQYLGLE